MLRHGKPLTSAFLTMFTSKCSNVTSRCTLCKNQPPKAAGHGARRRLLTRSPRGALTRMFGGTNTSISGICEGLSSIGCSKSLAHIGTTSWLFLALRRFPSLSCGQVYSMPLTLQPCPDRRILFVIHVPGNFVQALEQRFRD